MMAKAKKTVRKTAKKVAKNKNLLQKEIDSRFSIMLLVAALVLFILSAIAMSR